MAKCRHFSCSGSPRCRRMTTPPTPGIHNEARTLPTIMSFEKAVISTESKDWASYLTLQSATSMIDDEQSPAGWLTRLVGRVMLKSCYHVLLASCERGTLSRHQVQTSAEYEERTCMLRRLAENASIMRTEALPSLKLARLKHAIASGSDALTRTMRIFSQET